MAWEENSHICLHMQLIAILSRIEVYINSKDMYLRFASHTKSKAYTFKPINDVMCQVDLFGKPSVKLISHSNTMPLPYFYKNIT